MKWTAGNYDQGDIENNAHAMLYKIYESFPMKWQGSISNGNSQLQFDQSTSNEYEIINDL